MENKIIADCKNCEKQFEIKEKKIQRGGRDKETAECTNCGAVIYTGKTSGTFEALEIKGH